MKVDGHISRYADLTVGCWGVSLHRKRLNGRGMNICGKGRDMPVNRSLVDDWDIVAAYQGGSAIGVIQEFSGLSRPGVYNVLRRNGVKVDRQGLVKVTCCGCGAEFMRRQSSVRCEGNYCTRTCYLASVRRAA